MAVKVDIAGNAPSRIVEKAKKEYDSKSALESLKEFAKTQNNKATIQKNNDIETIRKENSPKDEISTQNTFYSNINKSLNINNSYNIIEENKKEKTKILNKNLKKYFLNNYIKNNNNGFFRQYSPNYQNTKHIC